MHDGHRCQDSRFTITRLQTILGQVMTLKLAGDDSTLRYSRVTMSILEDARTSGGGVKCLAPSAEEI